MSVLEKVQEKKQKEQKRSTPTQDLVVISDVHAHPFTQFASGTGTDNSRLLRTLDVLRDSLEEAKSRMAPWICAGDIIHTAGRTKNTVLNLVINVLNEYPTVEKYLVWGNHDSRGKGASEIAPEEASPTAIAEAVENCWLFHQDNLDIDEFPTIYGEGAQPKREHYALFEHEADVGVFHFTVNDTDTPSGFRLESDIDGRELLERYNLAIVGDVHHPSETWWEPEAEDEGRRLLLVPGSPEHHNFGDAGEHGYWVVTMKWRGEEWWPCDAEMIPSGSPKFLTVESLEEIGEDDYNFYRIKGGTVHPDDVPANVKVIGAPPTTVEQRDLIPEGATPEEILSTWLDENPPEGEFDRSMYLDAGKMLLDEQEMYQLKDTLLSQVRAKNFFSYEEFVWGINEGVTLVVGEGSDFESNGAGKSTLFEAVYWALFGKTTKGVAASNVIRDERAGGGADKCEVELALNIGDEEVHVKRSRTERSIEVDVTLGGEPLKGGSATEVTEQLCEYLGITEDIFRALAYYSQEDVLLFSRATDGERKNLLGDLCGLQAYERARSEASKRVSQEETDYEKTKSRKEDAEADLRDIAEELDEAQQREEKWEEQHETDVSEAKQVLSTIQDKKVEVSSRLGVRLDRIEGRAEELWSTWLSRRNNGVGLPDVDDLAAEQTEAINEKIEALKTERAGLFEEGTRGDAEDALSEQDLDALEDEVNELLENIEGAKEVLQDTKSKCSRKSFELNQAEEKMVELDEAYEQELEELAAVRESGGGECPECGQEVPVEHFEERVQEAKEARNKQASLCDRLSEQGEELKHERDKVQGVIEEMVGARRRLVEKLEFLTDLQERVNKWWELDEKIHNLQEQLEMVRENARQKVELAREKALNRDKLRIETLYSRAEDYVQGRKAELAQKVRSANGRVASLEEKENPHTSSVEVLQNRLDKAEEKLLLAEAQLEDLAVRKRIFDYWSSAFGKQGIQSLLLEEVATEFNKVRQDIFPVLTEGVFDVQFSTTSRTQAGELREKTEFVIRKNGQEVTYDSLSGGERRRVDLGVMLTLALANARMRGTHGVLGLLVFDEVFGYLDTEGREALVPALEEATGVVPSIYVITQDDDMKSLFPQILQVRKHDNGISELVL